MPDTSRTIGFLTHTSGWGGTELHSVAVARELASRGHRVTLLEVGHGEYSARPDLVGDLRVHRVALPRPVGRLSTRFWIKLIRSHRLDTVVLPKGTFDNHWPRLDLAMRMTRVRSVCIEHAVPPRSRVRMSRRHLGGLLPGLGLWHWRYRIRIGLHRVACTRVIAVSNAIKRRLVEDYGYREDRVAVVHNGVDASVFRSVPDVRDAARARWGVPPSAIVFGTLGRLVPGKRLDRALLAFGEVVKTHQGLPLHLVLVGSGPEDQSLRRLAVELAIADRCIWPGESRAPWKDFPGFDCYLLTSESEGLSYSLLEAMACECVSIAVESGGIGEVLVDGVNGVRTGDAASDVAAAMQAVLSWSPEEQAALGRRARAYVIERHDQARQIGAVARIIEASPAAGGSA